MQEGTLVDSAQLVRPWSESLIVANAVFHAVDHPTQTKVAWDAKVRAVHVGLTALHAQVSIVGGKGALRAYDAIRDRRARITRRHNSFCSAIPDSCI